MSRWSGSPAATRRRTWFVDIALLSVSTFAVLLFTDGGVTRSILSLVTVFQAVITVLALRRWVPGIWGTGGRVPFRRLRDFGVLLLVVITTALLTALLRTLLGQVFTPGESFDLLARPLGAQRRRHGNDRLLRAAPGRLDRRAP